MRAGGRLVCLALGFVVGIAGPARAFEARSGAFVADEACLATARIRDRAGTALEPGLGYPLLGVNQADATHYRIRLPGVGERWVPVGCGHRQGREVTGGADAAPRPEYVLAVTWQPAFCERYAGKPECAAVTADGFAASNLSLHGLWPQPRSREYCGVGATLRELDRSGAWHRLPPLELTPATRAALDRAMPGTRSALDRHEWLRHGTCFGAGQEEYVLAALDLLGQLNASGVRDLLAERIGGEISARQLEQAFDASFGPGAGRRVAMACERDGGRRLVVALQLSLAGAITPASALGDLLATAPEMGRDCAVGTVDPAGRDR